MRGCIRLRGTCLCVARQVCCRSLCLLCLPLLPSQPSQTLMDVILGRKTVGLIRGDILVRGVGGRLAVLATTLPLAHNMAWHAPGRIT